MVLIDRSGVPYALEPLIREEVEEAARAALKALTWAQGDV